jgi:DNA gyrase/topoisomerase IV subunit A
MESKQMTDEQDDLVFELQELQTEVEENSRTLDNLCNLLKQNNEKLRTLKKMNYAEKRKERIINDLQSKNWNIEVMNANYPMLEVVDENTVKIEGVEYKKVEKEKPQTLYDALCEKDDAFIVSKKTTCDIVRGWLIDHTVIETEDAEKVTFTIHKEQLQTPK